MPEKNQMDKKTLQDEITSLTNKMESFSSILEKFGLDLITKIGQQNSKLHMLTDKIDELNKATIQIKGLAPQLNNIIENQKYIESELDLMKTLIQKSTFSPTMQKNRNEQLDQKVSEIGAKGPILNQFHEIRLELNNLSAEELKSRLENLKEKIFEYTGGHKMLYEINKVIQELKSEEKLSEEFIKNLQEKIDAWRSKLL